MASVDALVYSEINNNMIDKDELDEWRSSIFVRDGTLIDKQITDRLNDVMKNTTIKRACCLGNVSEDDPDMLVVNARIPIPLSINSSDLSSLNNKFKYYDKRIHVPKSLCNEFVKPNKGNDSVYQRPCDDFYNVYCSNMKKMYMKEIGPNAKFDNEEFAKYKPECACYNEFTKFSRDGIPISPKCMMFPGCTDSNYDNGVVYLDPESRKNCPQEINMAICNQIINLSDSDFEAGGGIELAPDMKNECSAGSSTQQSKNATDQSSRILSGDSNDQTVNDASSQENTQQDSNGLVIILIVVIVILIIVAGYFMVNKK
jgi:hypothetical protein